MTPPSHSPDGLPRRSWLRRNWLWFLPVGCLSMLLLISVFIATIAYFVISSFKSSEPYQYAVAQATSHPEVIAELGEPVEASFFASGSINLENSDGEADIVIPISGPNGKAILYVEAEKAAGDWSYSRLVVEFEDTREQVRLESPPASQ